MSEMNKNAKFRYLPSQYVDSFFSDGGLLFTTFERCRAHEDATRLDAREGTSNFHFVHDGVAVSGYQGVGKNSYMLCTSSTASREICERFNVDSWIEIFDPLAFAEAFSKVIPGFVNLKMESCRYEFARSVERHISSPILPDDNPLAAVLQSGNYQEIDKAFYATRELMSRRLQEEMEDATYFLKEAEPFAIEDEFRFIFTVDHPVESPQIFVCKEAIKYCRPSYLISSS